MWECQGEREGEGERRIGIRGRESVGVDREREKGG